ncbi:Methyl sulfide methyltransferase-associated sensor [uncultured archaeon]|nr:Methyl sulfide methyltransferase-associated sensor [uncultured archaeon]
MKSLNITQKLIIFLILISLLPSATVTYINYSSEKAALEKSVFDDLSALVEAKNTHINTVVNFRIEQVKEVSTSNFMQQIETGKTGDISLNLLRVQKQIPEFIEISALDSNGTVVASTEAKQINKNYAGEDFFKNGTKGLYLGNINYYDNRTAYIVSYNVLNRSTGKPIGVVAARIIPVFIYDATSDYTGLGETGESLLVQKRGNEVVFLNPLRHNASAALNLKYLLDSSLAIPAILAASGENGTIQALDYRGKEVFAAYTYVPIGNWGLVVKIDSSEALIPAQRSKERFLALGIFYFAVVAVLAYFLGRRLTAPLIRLSDASRKVAKGYLTVHIEPETRDEIGELAQSFNVMVQRLKEVYEGLEQKVKERTQDLDKRNLELANLYEELKYHDETLETLYEIDRVVSQSLELDELLNVSLTKTLQVTSADAGWIYLLQEGGETLNLRTYVGISPELAEAAAKIKVGQGVSGMAVKSGKPVTMDIENYPYPQLITLMEKDGIKSLVGIPLVAKGKVGGAMVLSNRKHRIFKKEDIDLLSSIGSQIGVAVENARLYSELKRHDETLETLFEIDRVVSESLDLDEIFREALAKTILVTSSDAGAIYTLEEDGKTLKLKTSSGLSMDFVGAVSEIEVGMGVAGGTVLAKKPLVTDIDRFPSRNLVPSLEKEGLVTIVGAPLMAKGRVVGAMNLGNRSRRIFSKEDLDVLASIGGQIGVAIENARLYQEAKTSYEKLQAAYEELKSLDRMKSEFLSNVSHELKTPLVSIRGYSELLHDEKLGLIKDEQKKSLEAIIRNADRLTRLINSILFISKMQAEKLEFQFRPVDMDEIVKVCVDDARSMIDTKQITFEKDIPGISKVNGEKDRFIEVISNLLDNAIKFTPTGGKISIKARDEEEFVHLEVIDNGIGIPLEIIPKLFSRFYQADASASRKYGGTGLGLYITKNIVDAFHGKIWIESEIGKGTKVHVLLPIAR